jgi:hypothetical protein
MKRRDKPGRGCLDRYLDIAHRDRCRRILRRILLNLSCFVLQCGLPVAADLLPNSAINGFTYAFPDESGVRNPIRGEGSFGLNMNLSARAEQQALQFRWSVFDVTNSARFDIYAMQDEVQTSNTFGNYTQTLTSPREMEFRSDL